MPSIRGHFTLVKPLPMNSASTGKFIGFPPGFLVDHPLRVSVINEADGWIAFDKPAGVAIRQHPWNHNMVDMDTALNKQLKARKPELLKTGATLFGSIYNVEPELSGVALFAKHRDSLSQLRNLVGSEKLLFTFLLVTKSDSAEGVDELIADAPLLVHNTKPKMIPSTARGKKARTHFQRINKAPSGWSLWKASTPFPRFHQIRAHAAVQGIAILGDALYSGPRMPLLSELMPGKRIAEIKHPIFTGIPLHLSEVRLPDLAEEPETVQLSAALPESFRLLLERLQLKY